MIDETWMQYDFRYSRAQNRSVAVTRSRPAYLMYSLLIDDDDQQRCFTRRCGGSEPIGSGVS